MDQDKAQYIKMTERPIGPLIGSLAVPTIVSMMVTAIYNMADTFFVSKLGTSASGAVGIVFSLMAIIQAVGFTVGMGSGTWNSRLLGQKKTEEASSVASSGLSLAVIIGLALSIVGLSNLDGLMRILGASSTILPYARDYARFILLAAPIMSASFVLNNILRAEGKAKFAMIGIGTGGMLNIALDPLFIFAFELGIAGAAIATAVSQCVSFLILLTVFLRGKTIKAQAQSCIEKNPGLPEHSYLWAAFLKSAGFGEHFDHFDQHKRSCLRRRCGGCHGHNGKNIPVHLFHHPGHRARLHACLGLQLRSQKIRSRTEGILLHSED